MARSLLQIVMDAVGAGKVKSEINQVSDAMGDASQKASLFDDALKGAVAGLTVGAVINTAAELTQLGIETNRAELALTAYAGSAMEAERTTKLVQEAAGGTISRLDAMQNAAQLMAMGLAGTAGEAAELTKVAITLGASMGRGPQESFQDFALLLANQSIPRLDTFGISSGRVRARINELTAANSDMSRETAFMTAVMEDAQLKMVELEEAGFEAGTSVERITAHVEDAKIAIGTFLADGLLPWIDGILAVNDAIKEQEQREIRLALATGDLENAQTRLTVLYPRLATEGKLVEDMVFEVGNEMENRGTPAAVGYASAVGEAATSADELAEKTALAKLKIGELTEIQLVTEAVGILNQEMAQAHESGGDIEQYQEAFVSLTTRYGLLTDEQAALQVELQELRTAFMNDGVTPAEQVALAFDHLIAKYDELEQRAQNPIRFSIFGVEGVGPGGTVGDIPIDVGQAGGGDIGQSPGGGGR